MEQDPHSHVACEVTAITDGIHIFGEITSTAQVDYEAIARQTVREIGYNKPITVLTQIPAGSRLISISSLPISTWINFGVTF